MGTDYFSGTKKGEPLSWLRREKKDSPIFEKGEKNNLSPFLIAILTKARG